MYSLVVLTSGSFGFELALVDRVAPVVREERHDRHSAGGLATIDELAVLVVAELDVLRGAERLEGMRALAGLVVGIAAAGEECDPEDRDDDAKDLEPTVHAETVPSDVLRQFVLADVSVAEGTGSRRRATWPSNETPRPGPNGSQTRRIAPVGGRMTRADRDDRPQRARTWPMIARGRSG